MAIDDWYAIVPHGNEYTATTEGEVNLTAEHTPSNGSLVEALNDVTIPDGSEQKPNKPKDTMPGGVKHKPGLPLDPKQNFRPRGK